MRAIPKIDLRDGFKTPVAGKGVEHDAYVLGSDPIASVRDWARLGFQSVHVVDLRTDQGSGAETEIVRSILSDGLVDVHVEGNARDCETIEAHLADGASLVVLGDRAIDELDWLAEMAGLFPGELILGVSLRDRQIVLPGQRSATRTIIDLVDELDAVPLGGLLIRATYRDVRMQPRDLRLVEELVESVSMPLHICGDIATMRDLHALEERGVAALIMGTALQSGALDPRAVVAQFSD